LHQLNHAYASGEALFSNQLRDRLWARTTRLEAITSTAACLVAISRARLTQELAIDAPRSIEAIVSGLQNNAGAIGLCIWANAVVKHLAFQEFLDRSRLSRAALCEGFSSLTTMELAWLVSGLVHQGRLSGEELAREVAAVAVDALLGRQMECGLFVHAAPDAPIVHRVRRFVSNFADQIYPVQALAFASLELSYPGAREAAVRCADALLRCQGPLYQWWWHYDPRSCSVIGRYPVYSVHQYGMAPMAFLALAAAGAPAYRDRAWAGLQWLSANEAGLPLVDEKMRTVWRDIHPRRQPLERFWSNLRLVAGIPAKASRPVRFLLNRETRPYEWGWCLFAAEQMASSPPFPHLV
jgi:hypothetical protein